MLTTLPLILTSSFALAHPQASPTPSPTPIPWSTKLAQLRTYILSQPTLNATAGYYSGPSLQLTYPDNTCLQIRFYNWNCAHDIPYKPSGVAAWLDSTGMAKQPDDYVFDDAYRFYVYGYYRDPDDGFGFYDAARLTFGGCGNRGPQSACGMTWCVDGEGGRPEVPEGEDPWVDPNERDGLCPWLRNGTVV